MPTFPTPTLSPVFAPDFLVERVLYRDAMMLVVDKPAGLPVHAGSGGGANLEQFLGPLTFGLPRLPALAHRLDRDTSGCLVLGRHRKALAKLGKLFSQGKVEKVYWAVVIGALPEESGRIDVPLQKVNRKDGWRMFADPAGQPSITDYRVLGRTETATWVEFRPRTGRTHQIRVHSAAIGCPVLGDPIYGSPLPAVPLHLHARQITIPLYPAREPITVTAEPPQHMLTQLAACGWPIAESASTGAGSPPADHV